MKSRPLNHVPPLHWVLLPVKCRPLSKSHQILSRVDAPGHPSARCRPRLCGASCRYADPISQMSPQAGSNGTRPSARCRPRLCGASCRDVDPVSQIPPKALSDAPSSAPHGAPIAESTSHLKLKPPLCQARSRHCMKIYEGTPPHLFKDQNNATPVLSGCQPSQVPPLPARAPERRYGAPAGRGRGPQQRQGASPSTVAG